MSSLESYIKRLKAAGYSDFDSVPVDEQLNLVELYIEWKGENSIPLLESARLSRKLLLSRSLYPELLKETSNLANALIRSVRSKIITIWISTDDGAENA